MCARLLILIYHRESGIYSSLVNYASDFTATGEAHEMQGIVDVGGGHFIFYMLGSY